MKLCRFQPLEFEWNAVIGVVPPVRPEPRYGRIRGNRVVQLAGDFFGMHYPTDQSWPLEKVRLAPPVTPTKIICVGRNYAEHAAELGNQVPKEPLVFLKPPSSVIGPEEPILLPPESQRVEHEGEIALVIGRTCSRLDAKEDFRPYLLGVTCLNDVTARDLQRAESQWTRAKGFDTFCPLGPVIETEPDFDNLSLETYVNGALRQRGSAPQMMFSFSVILSWITRVMTLVPGDVVATGTPAGVGPLAAGDVVEVAVSGVGTLRNPVVARETES
jgi:2-keto-4-pentenoate hydratase/2-oxohepta-3-ene-1,7-dioic acid hydratase in catechol pathway